MGPGEQGIKLARMRNNDLHIVVAAIDKKIPSTVINNNMKACRSDGRLE